jgi:hypothetical protein
MICFRCWGATLFYADALPLTVVPTRLLDVESSRDGVLQSMVLVQRNNIQACTRSLQTPLIYDLVFITT